MIRRPPRSTQSRSSAASDVYKRQVYISVRRRVVDTMGVKEQYRDYVMTGFVKRVEPVVADHGDGALLYDADGTEYIDCFAGISVTNAGHHNTKILAAAKAQADKLVHACSYVYLSLIHISEPTRLGMISYAVFCLKKKKNKDNS